MELIDKAALVVEIEKEIKDTYAGREYVGIPSWDERKIDGLEKAIEILNTLEVKEVDLELENENNNPKITAGTKIRLKTNPDVILNIISTDCHEDEFECSNGSVLSLKQIEKYYDIIS